MSMMLSSETTDRDTRVGDTDTVSCVLPDDVTSVNSSSAPPPDVAVESLPFLTQQQIEEERLRGDILRYLVKNSNGTYHYSAELRTIIHDVVGIPYNASQIEFQETVTSLLDILHSDPQRRFLISGELDNILVKRCFVRGDEEEISDLVEEWRALIAAFLLESKRSVGLSDIGSSVPRPMRIPSSVKLIFIMKADPLNRFILKGDGNAAKARYNMQTDPDQESLWVAKWRDDIASFLTKQQWTVPSVALQDISTHVVRPFFLPARVDLLDILDADPFQRFVIIGFGIEAHVMIRNFRGDEPEIEEFVEHWRLLISSYLLSKSAMLGVAHPLLGLSEIGANVPRPPGVPTSVKLIDVMRADPRNRFIIKGDGNALRAKINSGGQAGRISFSNMMSMAQQQQQQHQHDEDFPGGSSEATEYQHNYSQQNMSKVAASRTPSNGFNAAGSTSVSDRHSASQLYPEVADMNSSFGNLNALTPPFKATQNRPIGHLGKPLTHPSSSGSSGISRSQSMVNPGQSHSYMGDPNMQQQRIRQAHQLQVQQFHQRQGLNAPLSPAPLPLTTLPYRGHMMRSSMADMQDHVLGANQRSPTGIAMGWSIAGTMSLDRERDEDRLLHPSNFLAHRPNNGTDCGGDYDPSCYNSTNYSHPLNAFNYDPLQSSQLSQRQDNNVVGAGRGLIRPPGFNHPNIPAPSKILLSMADLPGNYNQRIGNSRSYLDEFGLDHSQCRETDCDLSNISPSVSSVHSHYDSQRDRSIPLPHQPEYDSSSTRSDGDIDGESFEGHQRFMNFTSHNSQTNCEIIPHISPLSSLISSQPPYSLDHSHSGSLFSGGYTGLDSDRSPHSFGGLDQSSLTPLHPPSPPGLSIPTTNPRSFQSELSDPEILLVEEELSSQLVIPLDKWMIKAWLPIVFSGFDYDVIDSFVARLRDDGGFVTVQDLLDAVARDELTRDSLAAIAGFKVGHCNRLDKALSAYTTKCIPK